MNHHHQKKLRKKLNQKKPQKNPQKKKKLPFLPFQMKLRKKQTATGVNLLGILG